MSALGSELFRLITPASAQRVWETLTASGAGIEYLYGLVVEATWQPGSTVTAALPAGPRLAGEVLRVDEPRLLSYTLGDTAGEPSAYVTWEVDAGPDATIVRLYVDEVQPSSSADIERAWLPVVAALEQCLRRGRALHPEAEDPRAETIPLPEPPGSGEA
jgi:uncharacterized protein YndB with AHSA1/START domain